MQRVTIFYQNFIAFNSSFLPFFKQIESLQKVLGDGTNNKGTRNGALSCYVGMARFQQAVRIKLLRYGYLLQLVESQGN